MPSIKSIYRLIKIDTPRLLIRPVRLGDEVALNQAINRSLDALQRWMPWAKDPSMESTTTFVRSTVGAWKSGKAIEFPMVIIHKETNLIIAASGFNEHSDPTIPFYEIGYWIDTQYQGQGLVTEFVNALSRYALGALGAFRVQICTQLGNQKSVAVANRCSFTCEATIKNVRLDCKTNLPVDSLLFACCDAHELPPLHVTWEHGFVS